MFIFFVRLLRDMQAGNGTLAAVEGHHARSCLVRWWHSRIGRVLVYFETALLGCPSDPGKRPVTSLFLDGMALEE